MSDGFAVQETPMLTRDELKRRVCEAITQSAEAIITIGEAIRCHPELGFKEYRG